MRGVSVWLVGLWCAGCLAIGAVPARSDVAASQPKDVYTELYLRDGKSQPVRGTVLHWSEGDVTIKTAKGETTLPWTDATATSACLLRSRLIDKTSAKAWLELGTFAWGVNARDEARVALDRAAGLDPTMRPRADAILRTPAGALLKPAAPAAGDEPAAVITTGLNPAPPATQAGELFSNVQAVDYGTPTNFVAFGKSTPAQNAAVMGTVRKQFAQIAARLKLKISEFQTDHFVVFADAGVTDKNFIKKTAEDAYAAVTARFDFGPDQTLFLGKIPLFVFGKQETLLNVAQNEDNMFIPDHLPGYYVGGADGHLAMGPPALVKAEGVEDGSMQIWAHVLTRETTHAFLARWRSNRPLPAWLAQGAAETVSAGAMNTGAQEAARIVAAKHHSIQELFADAAPQGEWFPVMQTLADMLAARDAKAFVELAKAIKDGKPPNEALKAHYRMDYPALEKAWREAIKK